MEDAKPVKGRKKLHSPDKLRAGVNEPEKKLVARKKVDKLMKKKAPLPRVRSQSVSPTSVATSTSRIKEVKNISKTGNKTDKGIKGKRNSLPRIRSQSVTPPSVAGVSRIREPRNFSKTENKTDKVAITNGKAVKPKDTEIAVATKSIGKVKKTQNVGTVRKTKDTGIAKKTKDTGIAKKTKDTGIAKKTKDTGTAEEGAGTLNITFEKSKEKVSEAKSIVGNKIQKREIALKKLTLLEDVYEAIATNGQPKKGVSSQAIKNYIFSKRGAESTDGNGVKRLNTLVNNALRKGMEDGSLQRPTTSKGNGPIVSAAGRFLLTNKVVKPKISMKIKAKKGKGSETVE